MRAQEEEKEQERQRTAKRGSSSNYGGIAAVFVLGVGLLIVGFSLPVDRQEQAVSLRLGGLFVLAFGILVMMMQAGWLNRTLVASVVAFICSVTLIFSAARSEMTGEAIYHHNFLSRHGWRTEPVTRQEKPEMFREATDVRWLLGMVCALVCFGSFMFYRKTERQDFMSP